MKISKFYKPKSIYIDRAGTKYTVFYKPHIKAYHMVQLQVNNETIANSGCVFTKLLPELKYAGPLNNMRV